MTASVPLDGTGSGSFSIPDLVKLAGAGSIRIPTFQRAYVWDAGDVRRLFDSVFRGFPIGTILLWRQPGAAEEINFGPIRVSAQHSTDALWVVDGQQRITSLFGALSQEHKGMDERFEVYFDLSTSRFINPRRGVVPPRAIPVREALETRRLLTWLRQHESDLEVTDFDLADRLGGAIRDYRIPAYVVSGNDQALLREVFDRVNSAGRPISRAQVFHALFANDAEPGSPATVVQELKQLGFGQLDENRIVQSLLAVRGGNVQRDLHEEFEEGDDPADWYDKTEQALALSIKFLQSEGVPHLSLMPSTLPFPVLAAFFHLHPEPDTWILRLLSRWLWRGWVHGFGSEGGQTPTLRRAIQAVNPRRLSPQAAPPAYEAIRNLLQATSDAPVNDIPLDRMRTDNANGRLTLLSLASLKPLNRVGAGIDLANEFNKRGVGAITGLVPLHRSDPAARGFWPAEEDRPSGREDPLVLKSHAIYPKAAERLRDRDIAGFLAERRKTLKEVVGGYLESRLEPGAIVRPPLADLMVAEEDDE